MKNGHQEPNRRILCAGMDLADEVRKPLMKSSVVIHLEGKNPSSDPGGKSLPNSSQRFFLENITIGSINIPVGDIDTTMVIRPPLSAEDNLCISCFPFKVST